MAVRKKPYSNKIEFKRIYKKRKTNYKKIPKRFKKQSFFTNGVMVQDK